jgi:hypothetical protein
MGAGAVVLLVLGIVAVVALVQVAVWVPVIRSIRKRSAAAVSTIGADLAAAGEAVVRGPESVVYRGGSEHFPRVKGNGALALTSQRLVFRFLVKNGFEVPTDRIRSAREELWFKGAAKGGRMHLVLALEGGDEVGFYTSDNDAWISAIRALIPTSS